MNNFINNKKLIFDRWSSSYDWTFPSFIYQAIHKRLMSKIELPANANVLDLGCGTGQLFNRLGYQYPELRGTGLDLSAQMLRIARQKNQHRPRFIYIEGNAELLTFANNQFDAVFNTISFLHYPHPEQVISEVKRVLSPGSKFYLVDIVANNSPLKCMANSPAAIKFYSQEQREKLGNDAGLLCLGHHYLLGFVMLTIFTKPE
ncbi:class I SAM-dependent methyltransferase [Okeanomitos corallinicola TIOX110]|uniref:Class I SAM-dependent methyltransferase n=1 Tax=Okeanomitos corallinicola TIOX110 TaxID=3133117 RepID=A0ABZ2UQ43_9CYAN